MFWRVSKKEAAARRSSKMESRDHSNAANPKSLMSRGSYIKSTVKGRGAARNFSTNMTSWLLKRRSEGLLKTLSNISIMRFLAACIAALCLEGNVWADNATTIAKYVESVTWGDLKTEVSGNTVTITGTLLNVGVPTNTDFLTFNIDAGVTVVWRATLSGTPSFAKSLINISGGSGVFEVQSGMIASFAEYEDAIMHWSGTVNISGGKVCNTNGGSAITSASVAGSLNISDGTVSGGGFAVIYGITGALNISGGIIYNERGSSNMVTSAIFWEHLLVMTGGTVENTMQYGSAIRFRGTVNISGGTVSARDEYAISGVGSTYDITVSGSAKITSAYTDGTIEVTENGTLNIYGGTVENTLAGRNAINAHYTSYAVNNYSIKLGGNPTITGSIYSTYRERLIVLTDGTNAFAPDSEKKYTLNFPNSEYVAGGIAVLNGRNFPDNFVLTNSNWIVSPSLANLVMIQGPPVITINTHPAATTNITAGSISGNLTVSASVTQSATISYQWYSNTTNNNTDGIAIEGAKSSSFTIPTTLSAGTYYYFCEVSATSGAKSVRSNVATVVVEKPAASDDATLKNLTVSNGVLTPTFAASVTIYTVNVENSVTNISIIATANHINATVSGNVTGKSLNVGINTVVIIVTAENGTTSKTYTVTVIRAEEVTGVEESFSLNQKIYPNPFNGTVRITCAEVETGHATSLRVANAAGDVVHTQNITSPDETIRLEHLPAGVYFFIVEKDGQTKTLKVIKN